MTPLSLSLSWFSELKPCTELYYIYTFTTDCMLVFRVCIYKHKFRTSLGVENIHSIYRICADRRVAHERSWFALSRRVYLVTMCAYMYMSQQPRRERVYIYMYNIMRRALEASASIMPLGLCAFIIACCIFTVYLAKFKRENCACGRGADY